MFDDRWNTGKTGYSLPVLQMVVRLSVSHFRQCNQYRAIGVGTEIGFVIETEIGFVIETEIGFGIETGTEIGSVIVIDAESVIEIGFVIEIDSVTAIDFAIGSVTGTENLHTREHYEANHTLQLKD